MKIECFLSPFDIANDAGVICSATHDGFRRRRSKDETSACRVARSATGPGKPYWKRPDGSTGGIITVVAIGMVCGDGIGVEVVEVAEIEVLDAAAWTFFSERVEYIVAVMAAPDAALMAAMRAIVVFDMLKGNRAQKSPHHNERC